MCIPEVTAQSLEDWTYAERLPLDEHRPSVRSMDLRIRGDRKIGIEGTAIDRRDQTIGSRVQASTSDSNGDRWKKQGCCETRPAVARSAIRVLVRLLKWIPIRIRGICGEGRLEYRPISLDCGCR